MSEALSRPHDLFQIGRWLLGEMRARDITLASSDDDCAAVLVGIQRAAKAPTGDRLRDLLTAIRSDAALSERVPAHFLAYCMQFFADVDARARVIASVDTGGGIVCAFQKRAEEIEATLAQLLIARDELEEAVAFFNSFARDVAKAEAA